MKAVYSVACFEWLAGIRGHAGRASAEEASHLPGEMQVAKETKGAVVCKGNLLDCIR